MRNLLLIAITTAAIFAANSAMAHNKGTGAIGPVSGDATKDMNGIGNLVARGVAASIGTYYGDPDGGRRWAIGRLPR
jgi:hypothetical protein